MFGLRIHEFISKVPFAKVIKLKATINTKLRKK